MVMDLFGLVFDLFSHRGFDDRSQETHVIRSSCSEGSNQTFIWYYASANLLEK